ncbi:MAG: hypothetical protein CL811_12440 [Colwelliaceae bacterium]|nr:hypothetical protein [Colwelliaceae bacterium]|tara:strand:+ start:223 stop:1149 length:927 start_codon:yes stop_codon:yes gene_type:complete
MRIKLKRGRQRELILLAKKQQNWAELSKKLGINTHYLAIELNKEIRTLTEENYLKLCKLAGENFDKHILKRLNNNWGKSKGGKASHAKTKGNTKDLTKPKKSEKLAELFGAILGDGHIQKYIKNKKSRTYSLKIAGDAKTDLDYITNYLSDLMEDLFNEKPKMFITKKGTEIFAILNGIKLVNFLKSQGLKPGNKKANEQTIPHWILKKDSYLIACIRGLIDTDGSVHRISKENKNPRICFTSHIPNLLEETRNGIIRLGIKPSKIIHNRKFFITSKNDTQLYLKKIGFSNQKHLNRFISFTENAPVV